MANTRGKLLAAATVFTYPVRLVQLGTVSIAGYAVCYLVWMHHFHYCAWYGCGGTSTDPTSVPIGEVLFITASVLVVLEWMLFGGNLAFKAHTGKPVLGDSLTQFAFACFTLFVYSIGLVAFASIPNVRASWPFCYNMWNHSVYDPPEKYFCIVTQNAVNCGIMTLVVALLSLVELRKDIGLGVIRLDGNNMLPTEADALSIRDVAANGSS
ncbi:Fc.00g033210.m01.CDS01 [Cosmosporella sp. VM-42]